jgi:hypothetical protein
MRTSVNIFEASKSDKPQYFVDKVKDKRRTKGNNLEFLIGWLKGIILSSSSVGIIGPMMMTHTGNASNLQCQEVGRRKGAKEVVVIWAYSVVLVCLVLICE